MPEIAEDAAHRYSPVARCEYGALRRLRDAAAVPMGIWKEHLHTRSAAGLFDVSHMGQIALRPRSGDLADAAAALER